MIKGGFFLKSLRQLFIISLISCFTLLVNSSVSAYTCNSDKSSCRDFQFGEYDNSNGFKGAVIDNNLNFYGLSFDYYIGENRFLSIWWQEANSYFTGYYMTARNTNLDINLTSTNRCDRYWICSSRPPEGSDPGDYCSVSFDFSQLSSLIKDHNRYLFNCRNFGTNFLGCSVCSYNSEGGNYVCLDSYNSSNQIGYDFVSKEYINTYATENPYSSNVYRGTSFIPSTGSRLGGRLITSSGYTNNQMVEAYQCVGLQPYLCYGGFPIDNIFYPSEGFADFTGYVAGQGATIFDLYNLYSSSFSSLDQFLNTVLVWTKNQQIDNFLNKPKALLMFGNQLDLAGFKVSYISTYCDLLLNKNNNSSYTGQSLDDLRAQSCYRSQHINDSLKNFDGSDTIGLGSDVGIFGSGDDVDFDPETFFSNMMEKISSGLYNVSTGTAVGVIPGYIVLFTLALIFIRLISH